jgi:hypothetical protein
MKFGIDDLIIMPLKKYEFRKNWYCKGRTLLKGLKDAFPIFYVCHSVFIKVGTRAAHKTLFSYYEFH